MTSLSTLRRRGLRPLLAVLVTSAAVASSGTALAAGGDDGGTGTETTAATAGDFSVTVNGRTYNPAAGRETRLQGVTPTGPIVVRGTHVTYRIDPATLGVYDYTLTGAPSPERMVTAPTDRKSVV